MADQNIPSVMAALTLVLLACLAGESLGGIHHMSSRRNDDEWMKRIAYDEHYERSLPTRLKSDVKRFSRNRRSLPETPHQNDNKLNSTTVYLPDTERHSEAYVHWSGNNSEAIFVLTRQRSIRGELLNSKVWWTSDYGDHYYPVNFGPKAKILYFIASHVDSSKVIFVDVQNRVLYITEDELKTNVSVGLSFEPYRLVLHPTNASLVLAYSIKERELHCSEDFGRTWHLLQSGVTSRFFWAVPDVDEDLNVVHLELQNSMGEASYRKCQVPDCKISGSIVSPELGHFDPTSMLVVKEYIFVQKSVPLKREIQLYVSYKRGPFRKAYFPTDLHSRDFLIVNADEGQVFLAVSHHSMANLYLSDPTGQFFVLALENIAFAAQRGWFDIDLHEVKGLKGVYFVNQVVPPVSPTDFGVKTLVSFDKGGQWQRLPAPENHKSFCAKGEECFLNLHLGIFSYVLGTMSERAAPGLIIGHGSVGASLSALHIGVFHSRDGGLTWNMAPFEGIFLFNILDQGSIMTAVLEASVGSTDTVYYSCDEGQNWYNQTFQTDQELRVDGVLNEPGITTLMESVYGHTTAGHGHWTMVKLDFSPILTRQCSKADYQEWTPPVYGNGCILGESTVFEQRKSNASCKNGRDYKRSVWTSTCVCEEKDFECDFGYHEMSTGLCQKVDKISVDVPVNCTENHSYLQTQGYRKVGGDKCQNGTELRDPYRLKAASCPVTAPQGLLLTTPSSVVCTNTPVTFSLIQDSGAKISTNYTWDFNDTFTQTVTGLAQASPMQHSFAMVGLYHVTVTAHNSKGTASSHLLLHVVDSITSLEIGSPWATKVGVPVLVELASGARRLPSGSNIHFVWTYGDEVNGQKPQLSWDSSSRHTYRTPGVYTIGAEAITAASFVFRQTSIQVFDEGTTIRLSFSWNIVEFNVGDDLLMRNNFLHLLRQILAEMVGVGEDRLATTLYSTNPVQVDVLILNSLNATLDKTSTKQIVDSILQVVQERKVAVSLFGPQDPMGIVLVTKASVVEDDASHTSPRRSLRALYIGVPVLVAAAVVTLLVLAYYRKKMKEVRRYSIIRSRNNSETLLEDDDDPPLDLNPDFRRTNHHQPNEDTVDLGSGSHLVMVTGSNPDSEDLASC